MSLEVIPSIQAEYAKWNDTTGRICEAHCSFHIFYRKPRRVLTFAVQPCHWVGTRASPRCSVLGFLCRFPPGETIILLSCTAPIIKPDITTLHTFQMGSLTWICISCNAVPNAMEFLVLRVSGKSGTTTRWDPLPMYTWENVTLSPHCSYVGKSSCTTTR